MRLLLDTHVFVWLHEQPERLERDLPLLADEANELIVSVATSWELAIKAALGKVDLPAPVADYIPSRAARIGATILPIGHLHAARAGELPPIHRDPFDRMLVAQAGLEDAVLLTADAALAAYGPEVRLLA